MDLLKSALVAGVAGAIIFYLVNANTTAPPPSAQFPTSQALWMGFVVGAGVQVTVRVIGVS